MTQRLSPKTSWTCDLLIIATLLLFSHLLFLGLTTLEISLKLEIKYFCICECIWGYSSNQVRCKIWTTHWHGCCDKAVYCIQGRYDEHSSPLSNQEFLSFVAFLELQLLKLHSYMEFLRSLAFIMGLSNDVQVLPWEIHRWDLCISSFYPTITLLFYHHPQSLQHLVVKASKVRLCMLSQL